jgi:hypothetical protein
MIFEKILKGTDLAFDITLDKTQYRPEEIVRGTIYLRQKKVLKPGGSCYLQKAKNLLL